MKQISTFSAPGEQNDFPSDKLLNTIQDENMRDLIKNMLIRDKEKRITIKQVQ